MIRDYYLLDRIYIMHPAINSIIIIPKFNILNAIYRLNKLSNHFNKWKDNLHLLIYIVNILSLCNYCLLTNLQIIWFLSVMTNFQFTRWACLSNQQCIWLSMTPHNFIVPSLHHEIRLFLLFSRTVPYTYGN